MILICPRCGKSADFTYAADQPGMKFRIVGDAPTTCEQREAGRGYCKGFDEAIGALECERAKAAAQ
jgi:hypothetical protein